MCPFFDPFRDSESAQTNSRDGNFSHSKEYRKVALVTIMTLNLNIMKIKNVGLLITGSGDNSVVDTRRDMNKL